MGRKGIAKRMLEYKANMCDPYCVNYYVNDKDTNIGHDHTIGIVKCGSGFIFGGDWVMESQFQTATANLLPNGHRTQLCEKCWVCIVSHGRLTQCLPLLRILQNGRAFESNNMQCIRTQLQSHWWVARF